MNVRIRSQVQASETRFLRRIKGVTLYGKVRTLKCENLRIWSRYFFESKNVSLDVLVM